MSEDNWAENIPPNEDRFDFDSEGVSEADVASRLYVDLPGKYHMEIDGAVEKFDTIDDKGNMAAPHILCPCVVIHGVPGLSPIGSYYYHRVPLGCAGGGPMEDWQKRSAFAFLVGVGLLKMVEGKIIDPATGTTQVQVKTLAKRLNQMQFIADIKLNKSTDAAKYKDKHELAFGKGAFPIDAPEVRQVPKNVDALKLIGMEHAAPVAVAGASGPSGASANGQPGTGANAPKRGRGRPKKEPDAAPASPTTSPAAAPASPAPAPAPASVATAPAPAAANDFDDL